MGHRSSLDVSRNFREGGTAKGRTFYVSWVGSSVLALTAEEYFTTTEAWLLGLKDVGLTP